MDLQSNIKLFSDFCAAPITTLIYVCVHAKGEQATIKILDSNITI